MGAPQAVVSYLLFSLSFWSQGSSILYRGEGTNTMHVKCTNLSIKSYIHNLMETNSTGREISKLFSSFDSYYIVVYFTPKIKKHTCKLGQLLTVNNYFKNQRRFSSSPSIVKDFCYFGGSSENRTCPFLLKKGSLEITTTVP